MVAGVGTKVDWEVSVLMDCKYMGWDYETYMKQPLDFIWMVGALRREEAMESNRESRKWQQQQQ